MSVVLDIGPVVLDAEARPVGDVDIAMQILAALTTAPAFSTDSYCENASGSGLTRADMEYYWDRYLADDVDRRHPCASRLYVREPLRLPPTIVVTAGIDLLWDDGIWYAEALTDADVPVDHVHAPDMSHAVLGYRYLDLGLDSFIEALDGVCDGLVHFFKERSWNIDGVHSNGDNARVSGLIGVTEKDEQMFSVVLLPFGERIIMRDATSRRTQQHTCKTKKIIRYRR